MTDHHILLGLFGLLCLVTGWLLHMAWGYALDAIEDFRQRRAERRTPEGRARLLAERQADADWEASQAGAESTLARLAAAGSIQPTPGALETAQGRTAALEALTPERLKAEDFELAHERDLPALPAAQWPAVAGEGDGFTDGTGPQQACEPEEMHGRPLTREAIEDFTVRASGAQMAADAERGKWGFVPVRMGTPPHGYPIMHPGGGGGYSPQPPPVPALSQLYAESERTRRLIEAADEVLSPKEDWDMLARQCSRELAYA